MFEDDLPCYLSEPDDVPGVGVKTNPGELLYLCAGHQVDGEGRDT